MDKKKLVWLVVSVFAVVAIVAVGICIHMSADGGQAVVVEEQTPVADAPAADVNETADSDKMDEATQREYEEFVRMMEELEAEAAKEGEEQAAAVEQKEVTVVEEKGPAGFGDRLMNFGWNSESDAPMPKWRSIWMDLNLTPEEEARVRQGFGIIIARYMALSPQEQEAEQQRMDQMRLRWDGMNEEERNAASQRIRDRFEEWRYSDRVELPRLSLD